MRPELKTVRRAEAELLDAYIKRRTAWPDCSGCHGPAADFVAPARVEERSAVFCGRCGTYTGVRLDHQVVTALCEALENMKDLTLQAAAKLLVSNAMHWRLCPVCDREPELVRKDSPWGGLALRLVCPGDQQKLGVIWPADLEDVIAQVMNKAVRRRFPTEPAYGEVPYCQSCGASRQYERETYFDSVSRYAQFHCGKCGNYTRTWDPN